jgi:hypothetical protein
MQSINNIILLPRPRSLIYQSGTLHLSPNARILCQGKLEQIVPLAQKLQEVIWKTQKIKWNLWSGCVNGDDCVQAVLKLQPENSIPSQGYLLEITPSRIELTASDGAGIFYGIMTLKQMLRQSSGVLPACRIEDHPDFPSRGVMLDISRDKVPTMETLHKLVDFFAELKFNHLELYTEHTFAYRKHPSVWASASPMTGEEILLLDRYCRERFIELVPNQNSFGHMERWLSLPEYRDLAECPDGFTTSYGVHFPLPCSVDPRNPKSLALLEDLYDDLLPHFSSRIFNVGCDETIDLGLGKSKEECDRLGIGRVYLNFLLNLYKLVKRHGRKMAFWGDIIIHHPELVSELPKDVIVMEWGYEATHPFDQHGDLFEKSGLPYFVCPGTSSWNSISGRTDNCLENLRNAAQNGLKHGAIGYLVTDWGDRGHFQYLPISYLGYTAGAALSWCYQSNKEDDFVNALNIHVFRDDACVMGKLAFDFGNVYQKTGHIISNATVFGRMLTEENYQIPDQVPATGFEEAKKITNDVIGLLAQTRMQRSDAEILLREFTNSARLLVHLCDWGLSIRNGTVTEVGVNRQLANQMRSILGEHCELWMARNRIGGLSEGIRNFVRLLDGYKKNAKSNKAHVE